jgi:hypothetical protein
MKGVALACVAAIALPAWPAWAWNQPTHIAINDQSIKKFQSTFASLEKYQWGKLDERAFYTGVGTFSHVWFAKDFRPAERTLSLSDWVSQAGDWADEPELYAAVRHFYDPMALSGVHYLTDQSAMHGRYDQPQVDAMTWALRAPDNPFSWQNALLAYKKAMEIPEDGQKPGEITSQDFKLQLTLRPKDRQEERDIYMARALRSLGETMHLMADMVQPAHVRNDSHPNDEPLEDAVNAAMTASVVANNSVYSGMAGNFRSAGGSSNLAPEQLFISLATFTNANFYSADTIYDAAAGIKPVNWEKPYPKPQLKNLSEEETTVDGVKVKYYAGEFDGKKVPMIRQRVSGWIFKGAKEKSYMVPPSYATDLAGVLLPIAVAANSDLMDHFFPTLELQEEYGEAEFLLEDAEGKPAPRIRVEVSAKLHHHIERDPAWQEAGLSIAYSGPAELVFSGKYGEYKTVKLVFSQGQLIGHENREGKIIEGPVHVYAKQGPGGRLSKDEEHTKLQDGDAVFIRIRQGGRIFNSHKLYYRFPVQELQAEYSDNGLREEPDAKGFGVREIEIRGEAVKPTLNPPADGKYLENAYTGFADLCFLDEKGRLKEIRPIWLQDGILAKIPDLTSKMVEQPLILYGDETANYKLTDWEKFYQIKEKYSVFLRIPLENDEFITSNRWSYLIENEELEGVYYGTLRLTATERFRSFVVSIFARIFHPIANLIRNAIDEPPMSYEEVRVAVDSATTSEVVEVPLTLTIKPLEGNKVDVIYSMVDSEGQTVTISTVGTFKKGELKFEVKFEDGTVMSMRGRLSGDTLTGTLEADAWMRFANALEGSWTVSK